MQAMATYHGQAAAFGRLCVETFGDGNEVDLNPAAAFGRLCVETARPSISQTMQPMQPPSGGCVLKLLKRYLWAVKAKAAAFGRLCVETFLHTAIN